MNGPELGAEDTGLGLFDVADVDPTPKGGRGRTELALEVAIAAAEADGRLKAEHGGLVGGARAGARALDVAERQVGKGVYAVAQLLKPYADVLAQLGLPAAIVPDPDRPPTGGAVIVPEWLSSEFGTPGA